jgi:hypothetical protein
MTSTLDPTRGTPVGPARTRPGWTSGRVVAMLIGALLALCSLGLLAGGGYLLSAATGDDGWLALGHGAYRTDGYAVATDAEDWSTASYVLGTVDKVRIRVTPADAATPVFVGMARPADLERYLGGVQYVTAHGDPGNRVADARHDGRAPATPPADAIAWTMQVTGMGTQTLTFDAQQLRGDQVVVVMNADGSRSVTGQAESAVTQPSLTWIGSGLLAAGVVLGAGAVLLVAKPLRRVLGLR